MGTRNQKLPPQEELGVSAEDSNIIP